MSAETRGALPLTSCWHLFTGGDDDQDFYIDKNTGSIVVARRLDAGKRSNYNLTVRVTDGAQAITTQVSPTHLRMPGPPALGAPHTRASFAALPRNGVDMGMGNVWNMVYGNEKLR